MLQPNLRTLVVDDNQSDRLVVRKMLEKLGLMDIQFAEDGTIAEAKIANAEKIGRAFQLVLLDWNMPGANGLKVLQTVRHSKLTKTAKVIIMTGSAESEVVEAAVGAGVNDFIVKPMNLTVLKEKLNKLFAK